MILGIGGLVSIITSTLIAIDNSKIVEITWLASVFIALEALIIRFYSIDMNKLSAMIDDEDMNLDGRKFINWMTIAMIVGLAATVIIHYDFIFGMISYLSMQICLIISLTNAVPGNIFRVTENKLRRLGITSLFVWILLIAFDYIVLVYGGPDAFVVIPYVVAIGIMAHYTWYGLGFPRPTLFRWLPVLASALFVYSDSVIGISKFGTIDLANIHILIIDLTYVVNIFLMCSASLFSGALRE